MKTISVIGLKGGSGKTSTAVPLACEASRSGATVVLDMDPTPSATQWIEAAGLTGDDLVGHRLDPRELERTIAELRDSGAVKWVVVDTPPVDRFVCVQAAGVANIVVIPVHIGSGDLAQLVQTLDLLSLPRRADPSLQVLIVLNHAGTMPAQTRATREVIEGSAEVQALGAHLARMAIPYRATYVNAKGNRPTADWWHFRELWREVEALL